MHLPDAKLTKLANKIAAECRGTTAVERHRILAHSMEQLATALLRQHPAMSAQDIEIELCRLEAAALERLGLTQRRKALDDMQRFGQEFDHG